MGWSPQVARTTDRLRHAALTERDLQTARHLAAGLSTAAIAAAMSISTNTARTRIRRLQRMLGAPTRAQVVAQARALDIL